MRIGSYEVQEAIGQGGMGAVYLARSPEGRDLAIKVLRRKDPEILARFEREKRLLGALGEAEGFVPLFDTGVSPQGPYLVMPLVTGGTLRKKLDAGPLSTSETLALGRALALALGAAHARGIVHRDMKPENVLFTGEGRPLIADLGLAKHWDGSAPGASQSVDLSASQVFRGTAGYMAPEQMQDARAVGPSADVFALGAVLYECLAGHPAFRGESMIEVMQKVGAARTEPLRAPGAPAWLVAAIERALARDPGARFADGLALGRALSGAAPSRRSRLLLLLIPVVLLAGVAALVHDARPAKVPAPLPPRRDKAVAVREQLALAAQLRRDHRWDEAVAASTKVIELAPDTVEAWTGRASARVSRPGPRESDPAAITDLTRALELAPKDPEIWVNRGVLRGKAGDARGAALDYTRAIELDPKMAHAYYNRGDAREALGDREGAMSDYTQALTLDPKKVHAWNGRGIMRESDKNHDGAIADFTRALEIAPGFALAWGNRGSARQNGGDMEGALADYERFLELAPEDPKADLVRQRVADLRAWAATPRGRARLAVIQVWERARAKLRDDDISAAIAAASEAITLDPSYGPAWTLRGQGKYAAKDLDGAIADCTRAIELDPEDVTPWITRATARIAKADSAGAIEDSKRAVALQPNNGEAWGILALCFDTLGDSTKAFDAATKAVALDTPTANAWWVLARGRAAKGETKEALDDIGKAIALSPGSWSCRLERSRILLNAGDVDGALAEVARVLERDPACAMAFLFRAVAREKKGDFDGVIADATRALELDSRMTEAFYSRAYAREQKGETQAAISDYEKFLANNQNDVSHLPEARARLEHLRGR